MSQVFFAALVSGVLVPAPAAAAPFVEVAYAVEQTQSLEGFRGPSCGRTIKEHAGPCRYGRRIAVRRGGSLSEFAVRKAALTADRRELRKNPVRFAIQRGYPISARGRELLIAGKSVTEFESAIAGGLSELETQRAGLERDRDTRVSVLLSEIEGRAFTVLPFGVPEGFPFPLANLANWDFGASNRFQRAGTLALGGDGGLVVLDGDGLVRPLAAAVADRELPPARGIGDGGETSAVAPRLSRR